MWPITKRLKAHIEVCRSDSGKCVYSVFSLCMSAAVNSSVFFARWGRGLERELWSPQIYCAWRSKVIWSHPWVWGLLVSDNDGLKTVSHVQTSLKWPEESPAFVLLKQFIRRKTKVFFSLLGTASWENSCMCEGLLLTYPHHSCQIILSGCRIVVSRRHIIANRYSKKQIFYSKTAFKTTIIAFSMIISIRFFLSFWIKCLNSCYLD